MQPQKKAQTVLQQIGDEIWIAEGQTVSFYGFPYPTRMAVVRLSNGELWVWSPTSLTDDLAADIDSLGPVRHLVEPNKLHHLFLPDWASAYPDARLYAPPGLAKKRRDLSFDAELGDEPDAAWAGELAQVVCRGSRVVEEVGCSPPRSRSANRKGLAGHLCPSPGSADGPGECSNRRSPCPHGGCPNGP